MNLVYIGDIVNTHGIKGEVKLISDFKFKEQIFNKGCFLYVGYDKEKLEIKSYRVHKMYDMLTFTGIDNINNVIGYKGDKVFINRDDFIFDGIIDADIIGLDVYEDNILLGKVDSILKNDFQDIFVVTNNDKKVMIPNVKDFVLSIDLVNKKILVKLIEGLRYED